MVRGGRGSGERGERGGVRMEMVCWYGEGALELIGGIVDMDRGSFDRDDSTKSRGVLSCHGVTVHFYFDTDTDTECLLPPH